MIFNYKIHCKQLEGRPHYLPYESATKFPSNFFLEPLLYVLAVCYVSELTIIASYSCFIVHFLCKT